MTDSWDIVEELGGEERALALLTDFYDRVFDDLLIGFLFANSDKTALVSSQLAYLTAHLGARTGTYTGPTIHAAHHHLPITSGMFDRRHTILEHTLRDWDVPAHVHSAWLNLDSSLRDNVVRWGTTNRPTKKDL